VAVVGGLGVRGQLIERDELIGQAGWKFGVSGVPSNFPPFGCSGTASRRACLGRERVAPYTTRHGSPSPCPGRPGSCRTCGSPSPRRRRTWSFWRGTATTGAAERRVRGRRDIGRRAGPGRPCPLARATSALWRLATPAGMATVCSSLDLVGDAAGSRSERPLPRPFMEMMCNSWRASLTSTRLVYMPAGRARSRCPSAGRSRA